MPQPVSRKRAVQPALPPQFDAPTGKALLVLNTLRRYGPTSQAAIARLTGLSPATTNNIVQRLRKERIADVRWVNGREALVALVFERGTVVSVRVEPQKISGAAFDFAGGARHGQVIDLGIDEARENGPKAAIELVRTLAKRSEVSVAALAGVAVAIQAPIDRSSMTIASWAAEHLAGWKNVPLTETFKGALRVPVVVDNDANLAALAEWTWGAGRGQDNFLYVTCSSQIGGGLVLDGKLHRGANGMAGEIGHMVLDPSGQVCFCGNRGCLSTVASERAIVLALGATEPRQSLDAIVRDAQQGNPACQRVLFEAGRYLGRALANASKVIAPSVIAIGGTLGNAGSFVFDGLRSSVEVNSLRAVSPSTQFVPAILTEDPILLGGVAALLSEIGTGLSELPAWMSVRDAARAPLSV